jgi:type IV pilus assembly protein PilC
MFSKALGVYPDIFPSIMINLIEAGEVGGMLDEVLARLAVHFEKEYKMNEKVKSALTYPTVIVVAAIACVTFILTNVMPTFVQVFKDMNVKLPLLTQILMDISAFLRNNALLLVVGLGLLAFGWVTACRNPKFRKVVDQALLKLPIFGEIIKKVAIARFTRTLGTLVRSGVSLLLALEVVKKSAGNLVVVAAIDAAQENVKEGVSLSKTLTATALFPSMVTQMISIGEESGALDKMLEKIADFYESEVEDVVNRLSSILEPLIIIFLGVTVGLIVIAIMIPLFDVTSGAGNV